MNLSGKEDHPNIQPSTRPGIELGTSGLRGHCANPSMSNCIQQTDFCVLVDEMNFLKLYFLFCVLHFLNKIREKMSE